jgi:hypothetical protein
MVNYRLEILAFNLVLVSPVVISTNINSSVTDAGS